MKEYCTRECKYFWDGECPEPCPRKPVPDMDGDGRLDLEEGQDE